MNGLAFYHFRQSSKIIRFLILLCFLLWWITETSLALGADLQAKLIPLDVEFQAKVIHIADGDTITVLNDAKEQIRIRLNGIDCPEKGQAYGRKATDFTKDLVALQTVTIETSGKDRYGRTIGEVILKDGRNLNQELVKEGWCWWYRKYAPGNLVLMNLEAKAREAKIGLWKDPDPIPPWEFRRGGNKATLELVPSPVPFNPDLAIRGNKRSKKYHRPDCPSYDQISPRNRVPFDSAQEAVEAGFELAGNCP